MKYIPGLPEHNSNVSHEHPLREFFVLVAGTIGVIIAVYVILGLLVGVAVRYIDAELEASLFGMLWDQEVEPVNERELELQDLLDQLGNCVNVGYPVTVRISESEDINAFAAPGGRVVVLSGLLDMVKTENGLAFVLAHELGHFKNRDHLRSMGRSLILLTISVILTGADSDVSALFTPVQNLEAAKFSKESESAADATALQALNCHYGHVGGATEFFEKMIESDEDLDWSLTHFFASHPQAQQRIDDLRALSTELGYQDHEMQD